MTLTNDTTRSAEDWAAFAEEESRRWAPASYEQFQKASRNVPGGTVRWRFFWPTPIFIERASGAYLYDLDGHQLIDCCMGAGPMVLGHSDPVVGQAITDAVALGAMYWSPREAELAERIVTHVPNAAWSLFVNSGTEATMAAIRIARAATGRTKIAKFEGGWHGWHDLLLWNFSESVGETTAIPPVAMGAGVPKELGDLLVVLPYNDPAAFDRIRAEASDVAAVIIEPIQGAAGVIAAEQAFVDELTALCRELGILVIADEVITGFRLGPSATCARYGMSPDLVTLGKIIGGGLPIGAVCGSEALRSVMVSGVAAGPVVMGGTFSANPITMAAGVAALSQLLDGPERYEHLNALGDRLTSGLREVFAATGGHFQVTAAGAMWGVHFGSKTPRNVRDKSPDVLPGKLLHHFLLQEGVVMSSPVHLGFLSCAHTFDDVDVVIEAHRAALNRMVKEGALPS
jgi:glutamate-1-semialdehyde 2,1-aminomutase